MRFKRGMDFAAPVKEALYRGDVVSRGKTRIGCKASKKRLSVDHRRAAPNDKPLIRNPRLLWANSYCLLDTSSGASISVREILIRLKKLGWEIDIVGATVFDDPKGVERFGERWDTLRKTGDTTINVSDGPLTHQLVSTRSTTRKEMNLSEADRLHSLYVRRLAEFRPDAVFFYGGTSSDFHIPHEARVRGIPSVAYLVNANYQSQRWCRDVDLIITDTQATADLYAERQGFRPVPIGKFIDPGNVIAKKHDRKHATLINPSWAKGAGIVAMLALALERRRPDITFEVVESRGSWTKIVRAVTAAFEGQPRETLANVLVTPNTDRIAEVYARSRIVLGLSQWWESGSRVLAEAMLNGIPAMVSNHGGSPEMVGKGGIVVDLPSKCHEPPFDSLPRPELLTPIIELLERVWDDEAFYLLLMTRALHQGLSLHQIARSTERLIAALKPLTDRRAGDEDHATLIQAAHKHGLKEGVPVVIPEARTLTSPLPMSVAVSNTQSTIEVGLPRLPQEPVLRPPVSGPFALELGQGTHTLTLTFPDEDALSSLIPDGCFLGSLSSNPGQLWLGSQGAIDDARFLNSSIAVPVTGLACARLRSQLPLLADTAARVAKALQAYIRPADCSRLGFVLFGNQDCASARLRGRAVCDWLDKQMHIKAEVLHQPAERYAPDLAPADAALLCARILVGNFSAVVFQKTCSAGHMQAMRLCRRMGVRVIYDDCDPRQDFPHAALVDQVIVSTLAMADDLRSRFGLAAQVIPDTLDFAPPIRVDFNEKRASRGVWIGTADKFEHFKQFRERLCAAGTGVSVTAISDHPAADIAWSGQMFPEILRDYGFGLVTLENSEWGRTKSPNRAVLMMANGLPVICERHPAYSTLIADGQSGFLVDQPEVAAACVQRLQDPQTWHAIASAGFEATSNAFAIDRIGEMWIHALSLRHRTKGERKC